MRRGFTLVELLVVISILAVLAAVGIGVYTKAQSGARDSKRKSDLQSLKTALYLYKQANNNSFCQSTGCPASDGLVSARLSYLAPNYIKAVPEDPKYPTDANNDYYVHLDTATFKLSAKLENTPGSNECTPDAGRNYCIAE